MAASIDGRHGTLLRPHRPWEARDCRQASAGAITCAPLTASRMSTMPPRGPGTAPFSRSRLRSASAGHDLQVERGNPLVTEPARHAGAL